MLFINANPSKIKTSKNDGFCDQLLSENDFETVLVNFCCYEYGANASEAVQKISGCGGVGGSYDFFSKSPHQNRCPPCPPPPLKNEAPLLKNDHPIET